MAPSNLEQDPQDDLAAGKIHLGFADVVNIGSGRLGRTDYDERIRGRTEELTIIVIELSALRVRRTARVRIRGRPAKTS